MVILTGVKPSTLDSDIKLTDTSYLTNIVVDSPWAVTFRHNLDAARAIFFVGDVNGGY